MHLRLNERATERVPETSRCASNDTDLQITLVSEQSKSTGNNHRTLFCIENIGIVLGRFVVSVLAILFCTVAMRVRAGESAILRVALRV